jgi:general stress protein 26
MSETKPQRVSVRMSIDEAWEMVENAHTGIFTTLRRDGVPVTLPTWFIALDRKIYIGTRGKKVKRVRHDPRCSFLVEAGERWADLHAVHLTGHAEIVEPDAELAARIAGEMQRKYGAFTTKSAAMPSATRDHYSQGGATIRITPDERVLNWDNRKLELS